MKTLGVVKDLGGGKGEVMGVTWELSKTYCVLLVQWQASFRLHQSLAFVLYATLNTRLCVYYKVLQSAANVICTKGRKGTIQYNTIGKEVWHVLSVACVIK